jgi:hypothetical protein
MTNHSSIILDIETLDTSSTSIILSIGMMAFLRDGFNCLHELEITPDFFEQLAAGRTYSADTIAFHRSKGTLPQIHGGQPSMLDSACMIRDFFYTYEPAHVWIQGPDFDRPILESFIASVIPPKPGTSALPWKFWKTKDARTTWDNAFPGVKHPKRPHLALEDCRHTLMDLKAAFEALKLSPEAA